jgi:hypothetical protein
MRLPDRIESGGIDTRRVKRQHLLKFRQLDSGRRATLIEAAWTIFAARLAIRLLPFRWIAPRLGAYREAPSEALTTDAALRSARQVGWAIQTLARFSPWKAKCLAQAVAGKWMLQRRRIPSTLYLGVDRGREQWLEAHAWLCYGPEIVIGESHHERFKTIAALTEDWL